jgi:tRNA dimethylallyltransferase
VKLIVVAGPTGTGKSELAVRLAESIGGEIVNFDSVQVYRGFDIGSAKPSLETRNRVPHHLFDIVDAADDFNAAQYGAMATTTCEEIASRGRLPILVGGTFFYLRALLSGLPEMPARDEDIRARLRRVAASKRGPARLHRWLSRVDPVSAARIPPADRHRVERALEVWVASANPISRWDRPAADAPERFPSLKLALELPRPQLVQRLDERVDAMYRGGLIDETTRLLERFGSDARPFNSIGYREAVLAIAGTLDLDAAIAETRRRTRAYAKRQMTWLRSERNVHWLDAAEKDQSFSAALRLIERFRVD